MKRLLILVPVLALLTVAAYVTVAGGRGDDQPVAVVDPAADVMPFPSATKPLPVPEADIYDPAWPRSVPPSETEPAVPSKKTPTFRACKTGPGQKVTLRNGVEAPLVCDID